MCRLKPTCFISVILSTNNIYKDKIENHKLFYTNIQLRNTSRYFALTCEGLNIKNLRHNLYFLFSFFLIQTSYKLFISIRQVAGYDFDINFN